MEGCVLEAVKELFQSVNGSFVFLLIVLLAVVVYVIENLKKLQEHFGIRTKWDLREEQEQKAIDELETGLNELRKDFVQDCKNRDQFEVDVTETLKEIREDIIDDKISRVRWEIIDFANCCKKREYNKEAYTHIIDLYHSTYKHILEKYGKSNGQVDMSMEYIEKVYAELLEKGFPKY